MLRYLLELLAVIGLIPHVQGYRYLGESQGWATLPGYERSHWGQGRTFSSWPSWKESGRLEDRFPAFRPGEDLRLRDRMVACTEVLEAPWVYRC